MGSALAMAAASFRQAKEVAFERGLINQTIMGVAMTAAVSTSRQRRGANTCRIAIRTDEGWHSLDIVFQKAHQRSQSRAERRIEEGLLCDLLTLMMIRHTIGLSNPSIDPAWGFEEGTFTLTESGLVLQPEAHHSSPLKTLDSPFTIFVPDDTLVPLQDLDLKQHVFPSACSPSPRHEIATCGSATTRHPLSNHGPPSLKIP